MALDITGLGSVADLASTVISKIWPDKTEAEKAQLAAAVQLVQGQIDINKVEASSSSVFVAGWRPFIGLAELKSKPSVTPSRPPYPDRKGMGLDPKDR